MPLNHNTPDWIPDAAIFFITICTAERSTCLTTDPVPAVLKSATTHYHNLGRWHCHLLVIMPDHIHALISFPPKESLLKLIPTWKSYTAKKANFSWQPDFFDHRLRHDESFAEKAHYLRMNPVRANLADHPDHWPHTWSPG